MFQTYWTSWNIDRVSEILKNIEPTHLFKNSWLICLAGIQILVIFQYVCNIVGRPLDRWHFSMLLKIMKLFNIWSIFGVNTWILNADIVQILKSCSSFKHIENCSIFEGRPKRLKNVKCFNIEKPDWSNIGHWVTIFQYVWSFVSYVQDFGKHETPNVA